MLSYNYWKRNLKQKEEINFKNQKEILRYWETNCRYVDGEYWIEYNGLIAKADKPEELINFLKLRVED